MPNPKAEAMSVSSPRPTSNAPVATPSPRHPVTPSPAPILEVHDVTVAYHRKPVLWDIDLTLTEPALVGVIGPNGAGKSTLIKAVLGLVPLASGRVEIFGRPLARQRRLVGYVPQRESVDRSEE